MPELIPAAPETPEWLAARRTGVTATDIVTILGLSSRDSAYSLYWRKLGQVPEQADSDRFRLGRELEPYVLARWREATGSIQTGKPRGGLYRHSERAWQMATLDARKVHNEPVELKTWADADRHTWGRGQVFDDDGTLLVHDDQVPAAVRAQVLWQMDVMDVAVGHVGVVFLPSGEFRSYAIEHDPAVPLGYDVTHTDPICDLCGDILMMHVAGAEFMARLRLELPAPDPDSSAATLAAVRARFARTPDKQAEIDADLWRHYVESKDEIERWEEGRRHCEIQLREQAGEASVLTVDGQPVARRITGDSQVKAHTRHNDYLRRIKQEADSDDHS